MLEAYDSGDEFGTTWSLSGTPTDGVVTKGIDLALDDDSLTKSEDGRI